MNSNELSTKNLLMTLAIMVLHGTVCAIIGYQSGQVDALYGKQEFKLVTNTVQSVTFESK